MKVSVLQWNIWYLEDIHNIAKFLRQNPADIICLQELTFGYPEQTSSDTFSYIADELGYNFQTQTLELDTQDWLIGNGIFTKFPIINKRDVHINEPKGTGGYDDQYRGYVEAALKIGGKTLTVGTAHMSYTDAFEVTPRKLEEADNLVEAIKANTKNFILTGDFNAQPDSEVIEKVSKGLVHAGPDFTERSWTTKPFSYQGFDANTLDWRLDYVFATPDIKIISSKFLKTNYSDHLPVFAEFEVL